MQGYELHYTVVFAGALLLAFALTPVALRIALRREALDHPGGHKTHASAIPYLGGVAICLAFSVAALVGTAVWEGASWSAFGELTVVLALALGLCFLGLVDDLRGIGPGPRFLLEAAAGGALYWQGVGVSVSTSEPVNIAVTILWVVGVTNALNLLDNMDGLSSGVTAIIAGSIFLIAALEGQFLVAMLAAALAGCALGFLRHNFQPARIYMGDAGSLFLGFMLAYLALKLRFGVSMDRTVLVPILVLTVPILDTTLVVISRIARGQSPLSGGRDHISHRLVHLGLSVRAAVGVVCLATAATGAIALLIVYLSTPAAWGVAGGVGVAAFVAGCLLARVPVAVPARAARRWRWSRAKAAGLGAPRSPDSVAAIPAPRSRARSSGPASSRADVAKRAHRPTSSNGRTSRPA